MATADNKQGKSEAGARALFRWERNWRTQTKDHIGGYVDICKYYFDFFCYNTVVLCFGGRIQAEGGLIDCLSGRAA